MNWWTSKWDHVNTTTWLAANTSWLTLSAAGVANHATRWDIQKTTPLTLVTRRGFGGDDAVDPIVG
jgi:hypothetical protein